MAGNVGPGLRSRSGAGRTKCLTVRCRSERFAPRPPESLQGQPGHARCPVVRDRIAGRACIGVRPDDLAASDTEVPGFVDADNAFLLHMIAGWFLHETWRLNWHVTHFVQAIWRAASIGL